MAELTDRLVNGRYRLIDPIGRGGMGTVWWARDEFTGREIAVKEVHLQSAMSAEETLQVVKRTHREALAAGRLNHPGLVAIYDVVVEVGRPWLIMEYVAGRSLEQVLDNDGPLSDRKVAQIGLDLLAALRVAHDAGIVHRDVKPSNVLLAASGRVVLTDFGIATWEGATTLTQTGTFMGSPGYVAPEVAVGDRATPTSDLWSLGATLYAAVEGRPPYDYETAMATLAALISKEPDPPQRADLMRPVLEALLQRDPTRRASAARTEQLLRAAVWTPPPTVPAEGRPRRWRVPLITAAVLTLAVVAGVVVGLARSPHRSPATAGYYRSPPLTTPSRPMAATVPHPGLVLRASGGKCRAIVEDSRTHVMLFDGTLRPGQRRSFTHRPLKVILSEGTTCRAVVNGVAMAPGTHQVFTVKKSS